MTTRSSQSQGARSTYGTPGSYTSNSNRDHSSSTRRSTSSSQQPPISGGESPAGAINSDAKQQSISTTYAENASHNIASRRNGANSSTNTSRRRTTASRNTHLSALKKQTQNDLLMTLKQTARITAEAEAAAASAKATDESKQDDVEISAIDAEVVDNNLASKHGHSGQSARQKTTISASKKASMAISTTKTLSVAENKDEKIFMKREQQHSQYNQQAPRLTSNDLQKPSTRQQLQTQSRQEKNQFQNEDDEIVVAQNYEGVEEELPPYKSNQTTSVSRSRPDDLHSTNDNISVDAHDDATDHVRNGVGNTNSHRHSNGTANHTADTLALCTSQFVNQLLVPETTESTLNVLIGMKLALLENAATRDVLSKNTAVCSCLVRVMKSERHVENISVPTKCARLLAALTFRHHEMNIQSLLREGAAPVLIGVMQAFSMSRELQLFGCGALRNFLVCKHKIRATLTTTDMIVQAGGIEAILTAMEAFENDAVLQEQCCGCLVNLLRSISSTDTATRQALLQQGAAACLAKAQYKFMGKNESIEKLAREALEKLFTQQSDSKKHRR